MIVEQVERRRGRLVAVTLDDGVVVLLDKTVWDESAYGVGSSLSTRAVEALQAQSDAVRARERALYLLSLQDYPAATLCRKVAEGGVPPEAAQAAVARLTELGLVDDRRLAGRMARDMVRFRRYPARRLTQELQKRGIPADTAREAAEQATADQPDDEQALALIRKKYYNKMETEDGRRKTAAALVRFGFSYETARRAVEAFGEAEDEGKDL